MENTLPSRTQLLERLAFYPRLPLAKYPTPLEFMPRLSADLGRDIYIKRDDEIGPGMGGNKTRKLEYLLAEAQSTSASKIATFGGLQSNHARITAAAARKYGMKPHIFYFEPRQLKSRGNLILNELFGSNMHFIPIGAGGGNMTLETTIRLVRLVARLLIGRHYFIPVGGHNWLGCLGYVRAAIEIDEQTHDLGIENAHLILASGTGGTLAGLLAGFTILNSSITLLGIDVGKLWKGFRQSIARLASEICHHLGYSYNLTKDQVPLIEDTYVGAGYGLPSPQCLSAVQKLSRLEGIVLDPIYTAKAFAALIDLVENHVFKDDEPVIFLHTGGVPGLFAYQEDIRV